MKYLKPLMLVIAGFAIAMLVSFKNEEPKKEYSTISYYFAKELVILYPDNSEKRIECKFYDYDKELNKVLNEMAKDGWVEKSTMVSSTIMLVHLERTKQ